MIETRALTRRFGSRTVLNELSLTIDRGEKVALLGANGSGKTTLLRLLATRISPSSGDAFVAGRSVTGDPDGVRRRTGFMPAGDGGFFPRFTGLENLLFFAALRGETEDVTRERLSRFATFATLEQALRTPVALCSSGMRQALALLRALCGDPEVLLLDEPTRGLDPESQDLLIRLLRDGLPRQTILFSTHSREEARTAAHRGLHLAQGSVTEEISDDERGFEIGPRRLSVPAPEISQ